MRARVLILFIATLVACTSSATPKGNDAKMVEVIPIHVTQPEPGTYKAEVDVLIDGHKKRFILDSGARKTSVGSDEDTQPYPAVGQDQSGGAFGKVDALDIIQPRKLELGPHVFLNPRLQRTASNRNFNLFGIDLLAETPFQVDLKNAKLNLMAGLSSTLKKKPIHRMSAGHIAVPITLDKKESFALFDTGAERTSIDLQFVKANPQLFKFVGTARGSDSTAHQQDTPIYQVSSLAIGNLQLNNVELAAFDFGDDFRKKLEGVPIIVGNNVIYQAKWSFDVRQGLWAVEPYMSSDQSKPAEQSLARQEKTFDMQWQRSLPVDQSDIGIGVIGGTEVRSLVSMNGKLYAGIGYWSDSKEDDPQLPGGQVLVLDSPGSKWKVDLSLDDRVKSGPQAGKRRYFAIAMLYGATFKSDLDGHPLAKPVQMLLAGVWDRLGKLQVLSKTADATTWSTSDIASDSKSHHAEIRSFFVYRDKITNIEHVFAGARINYDPHPTRIYAGAFDSTAGKIRWNETPEAWATGTPDLTMTTKASSRITAFVECNGKLYASVYNMIFERQDGPQPSWKLVFKFVPQQPFGEGSSGFRGLTSIQNPTSSTHQVLLVSLENRPCRILRIDPKTVQSVPEINVSAFLTKQWNTQVGYMIAGYNDMLSYSDPITSDLLTLIGFEAATPKLDGNFHHFNPSAHYLIRQSNGQYLVREIADHKLDSKPVLESVRTMVNSPFAEDPPGTIYAGGFDCNSVPVHNTAWIYRGVRVTP